VKLQPYRSPNETEKAILDVCQASPKPLSRRQICSAIGRAKSPHILEMIESLVSEGKLIKTQITINTGLSAYVYFVREHTNPRN